MNKVTGGARWWDAREARAYLREWQRQTSTLSEIREVEVVGSLSVNSWTQSLNATVRIAVSVVDEYNRQDARGNRPEYVSAYYEAGIEGDLTLFIEDDLLEFTGSLENVHLIEPDHISYIDS